LRPLLGDDKVGEDGAASNVSREHQILQGPNGMWTIAGGKLTTYRSMAAEMVDAVVKELRKSFGRPGYPRAATDREPLPGGEASDFSEFRRAGQEIGLSPLAVDHVVSHYGTEAAAIFNLGREDRSLLEPLHPDHVAVRAEVVHSVRRELARTVEDMLVRRLHLFYETRDRGAAAVPIVAALMGGELGWSADEIQRQADSFTGPR
jgi:glycerol-3-phosphate dehydrogenase